jgi:hypothetical protein
MIMADVLTWFLIISGVYLVLVCHWLAAVALFPGVVEACRERYARPVATTAVGLVVLAPLLVVGLAGANAIKQPGPAGAVKVCLLLLLVPALLGSAGLALRIGAGLRSPRDVDQPWRRVLRGGLVLAPTFLLPFLGWFIVLPWTLVSGFGATLLALRDARRAPATRVPEATAERIA